MSTDVEKLVVQLTADFRAYQRELNKNLGITNRQARAIENRYRQMNQRLDGIGRSSARAITAPLAAIGAALGTRELIRLTDTWTDLNSRVRLAAGGMEQGRDVMERLGEMARRTYSSLELTVEGYLSNVTALRDLGYSQNQSLDYQEALNNALVVSGAKGDRAARVQDALAKAMALGTLQGDNLNTVIATGGRVADALAAGLGTTVSGLRQLGAQGKITGTDIVNALTSQMQTLRQEAESMPATISDGFQLLNNALLEYVGNADQATGVSARVAEALILIADNFDAGADSALILASVIAGALVGRSLVRMIGTVATGTSGLLQMARALNAVRTAGGLAAALGGMGAAAGPAGLVIGGALVAAIHLFATSSDEASEAAASFEDRVRKIKAAADEAAQALPEAAAQMSAAARELEGASGPTQLEREAVAAEEAINELRDSVDSFFLTWLSKQGVQNIFSPEIFAEMARLREEFEDGELGANELLAAISALDDGTPDFSTMISQLQGLIGWLEATSEAARAVQTDLVRAGLGSGLQGLEEDRAGRVQRDPYFQSRAAANAYVENQRRYNALKKEERDLEDEIARVRKQAERDEQQLTEAQIREIAMMNLARREADREASRSGRGSRKKNDDYTREVEATMRQIAAYEAEAAAMDALTETELSYADALIYARKQHELLTAAKEQGLAITPALKAQIDELAQSYLDAANAADAAREKHEKFESKLEDFRSTSQSAFRDLKNGADGFVSALGKIVDKLSDMLMDDVFDMIFGKGTAGGNIIASGLKFLGFSEGGPTPAGPRHRAVGIVHAGENVWSQDDVRRAGGMNVVEALRRNGGNLPGYAAGGIVGMRPYMPPRIPAGAASRAVPSMNMTFAPQVHLGGSATQEDVAMLRRELDRQQQSFASRWREEQGQYDLRVRR